jgi:hypothetical protein
MKSLWVAVMLATGAATAPAIACEVTLRGPAQTCPAATYGPDDCQGDPDGKRGDKVDVVQLNVMSSGHVYGCESGSCYALKDLAFKGCKFTYFDRKSQESPEYISHFAVK